MDLYSTYKSDADSISVEGNSRQYKVGNIVFYVLLVFSIAFSVYAILTGETIIRKLGFPILLALSLLLIQFFRAFASVLSSTLHVQDGKLMYRLMEKHLFEITIPLSVITSIEDRSTCTEGKWDHVICVHVSGLASSEMDENELTYLEKDPETNELFLKMDKIYLTHEDHLKLVEDLRSRIKED